VVEVGKEAGPFLVSVVMQAAGVGGGAVAPCGYLDAGVPFEPGFHGFIIAQCPGLCYPVAYHKLSPRGQQAVLEHDQCQEVFPMGAQCCCVAAVICLLDSLVSKPAFFSYSLTYDIHQIVFEVVTSGKIRSSLNHEVRSLDYILRIVVVRHLRPGRSLIGVQ